MLRLFLFNVIILLGMSAVTVEAIRIWPVGCRHYFCSYTGDPHLVPFYSRRSYFCRNPGWEVLLSNPYVVLSVFVDGPRSAYSIINYALYFPERPHCLLYNGIWYGWQCSDWNCPFWTYTSYNTRVFYHKKQCLTIKISQWGGRYQIYIWQSYNLISQSKGVCVNWNCGNIRGRRQSTSNELVNQTCNNFITAAQNRITRAGDVELLNDIRSSCINDVDTTLGTADANDAAISVLQFGLENRLDKEDPQLVFEELDQLETEATQDAIAETNDLLARSPQYCRGDICLGSPHSTSPTTTSDSTSTESSSDSTPSESSSDSTPSESSSDSTPSESSSDSTPSESSSDSTSSDSSSDSTSSESTSDSGADNSPFYP